MLLLLMGCSRAEVPPGFQGVVEQERVDVAFEISGTIGELSVERGDAVTRGQALARLERDLAERARDARAAEAAALRAELALLRAGTRDEEVRATAARLDAAAEVERIAKEELDRQRALVRAEVAPSASVDPLRRHLSQATAERRALGQTLLAQRRGARPEQIEALEARLAAAEAAVAAEEEKLRRHVLRAPFDGVVVDRYLERGELATVATPVVAIADVTHPYVEVFVPQGDLEGIEVGTEARVRVDALAATLPGRVEHVWSTTEFSPRFLFSEEERQTLVVRVRVRIDDPEGRLPAGVPAFAELSR